MVAAASATAGCTYSQQTKFQMHFLPPAPPTAGLTEESLPPAPVVESNSYLQQVPQFLHL